MSSTRGTRVPEAIIRIVNVRIWILGRLEVSSDEDDADPSTVWRRDDVVVKLVEVGPREMLITCSIPARWIASMISPPKKSQRSDLS